MNKKISSLLAICTKSCVYATTFFCSVSAWATDSPATMDEVIVTAQMREENPQSIGIAMGVYDKDFIAHTGAGSLTELEFAMPNLNFGFGGRNTRGEITIRGVGGYTRNIGTDARVAVYVDGVLSGRSSSFDQSLLDVEQIEVLRGPQGTLSGTNALAGAINITTQKPENKFFAEVLSDVGNYNLHSMVGKVNVPLTTDLYASLLIGSEKQDGFIRNITLDRDLQGINKDTAKLKFRYVGFDNLTLDVGFDYLKDDNKSTNAEALANGRFNGFTLAPKPYEVADGTDEFEKRELKGTTLTATYLTPENFQWVSITGVRKSQFSERSEEDYSPLDVASSLFDEKNDQFTQEFRVVSPSGENFDYVIGTYFLDQNISTQRSANAGALFPVPHGFVQTPASAENNSYSGYMHGNFYLTTQWELNSGVRYVHETKNIDFSSVDTIGSFVNVDHMRDEKTFNEILPKLGINYHTTQHILFYSSISRGYKSGGWNADFLTTLENFQFNPEYAINYELGVKSTLLDDQLTLDVSSFVTKIHDFQVFQFVPSATKGTILSLTNAGKVTSQGLELDIKAKLSQSVSMSFNTTFTQARFDEFKNGGGTGVNYDNNYLPYAPEHANYLAVDYQSATAESLQFYSHIDYSYTGKYFSNPDNAPTNAIVDHYTSNVRTGITIDKRWDISLWVKNLTNQANLRERSVSFLGVPRGYYDPPRFYGLSIKYSLN